MSDGETSRPIFARFYSRFRPTMDREGLYELRRDLLAGLTGRVIEVGCGDGGNFGVYPAEVSSVLAVEPERYLRARASELAAASPVPVEVVSGSADALPGEDGAFDAAVVSLVLCSVPDQMHALAEIARVLKPGGQLRFLEHVAASGGRLRSVQRFLDATIWPFFVGGCHCARDTEAAIQASGFTVESLRSLRFPDQRCSTPTVPHILGIATVAKAGSSI